jgi:hypothetical protein
MDKMENTATLDWTRCFSVPTVAELRSQRFISLVAECTITDDNVSPLLPRKEMSKGLKSVMFILKTASITCAVLTLAPVVGGAIGTALGIGTVHAMTAGASLAGATYVAGSSHAVVAAMAPVAQATADAVGWEKLIAKVLWIVDYLMDGVIIFSGISWMFGNRTKAIELLLGAGVGYMIVRHHEDIKNFFALL